VQVFQALIDNPLMITALTIIDTLAGTVALRRLLHRAVDRVAPAR
jgi:hypothetical protein